MACSLPNIFVVYFNGVNSIHKTNCFFDNYLNREILSLFWPKCINNNLSFVKPAPKAGFFYV